MAWGAGPWWAGAGRVPCAVVGNWGPEWNVGGTLILSATVVLRHRSPLPPPICSFQRRGGKRSCTHMHELKNMHRHLLTRMHTSVITPPLICSFGFSYSVRQRSSSPTRNISIPAWLAPTNFHFVSLWLLLRLCNQTDQLPHVLVHGRGPCDDVIPAQIMSLTAGTRSIWEKMFVAEKTNSHGAIRSVIHAGVWGVSVTDACIKARFHNQPYKKMC